MTSDDTTAREEAIDAENMCAYLANRISWYQDFGMRDVTDELKSAGRQILTRHLHEPWAAQYESKFSE